MKWTSPTPSASRLPDAQQQHCIGVHLEHPRRTPEAYAFGQARDDAYDADMIPPNLDRRIEILFPIDNTLLRQAIVQDILHLHFQDNLQARRLRPDGSYERLRPSPNTEGISAQDWLLQQWKTRSELLASQAQTRLGQGEQTPSDFLPVPKTVMTATLAPPLPSSNGDGV